MLIRIKHIHNNDNDNYDYDINDYDIIRKYTVYVWWSNYLYFQAILLNFKVVSRSLVIIFGCITITVLVLLRKYCTFVEVCEILCCFLISHVIKKCYLKRFSSVYILIWESVFMFYSHLDIFNLVFVANTFVYSDSKPYELYNVDIGKSNWIWRPLIVSLGILV